MKSHSKNRKTVAVLSTDNTELYPPGTSHFSMGDDDVACMGRIFSESGGQKVCLGVITGKQFSEVLTDGTPDDCGRDGVYVELVGEDGQVLANAVTVRGGTFKLRFPSGTEGQAWGLRFSLGAVALPQPRLLFSRPAASTMAAGKVHFDEFFDGYDWKLTIPTSEVPYGVVQIEIKDKENNLVKTLLRAAKPAPNSSESLSEVVCDVRDLVGYLRLSEFKRDVWAVTLDEATRQYCTLDDLKRFRDTPTDEFEEARRQVSELISALER